MKVTYSFKNSILSFTFILEKDDRSQYTIGKKTIKLNNKTVNFIMPDIFNLKNIHPDLLGLTVILIIFPYVGKILKLPFEISQDLAKSFSKCGKIVLPINPTLTKRDTNNGIPSLSFSAGCDSAAALLLMNKNCQISFLDRIINLNKGSIYNKDSIYLTLDILINNDFNINVLKTDLEYIREPVGFPIDIACGIPNILLADVHNIDSIAYGYANHHKEFLESDIEYICTGTFKLYMDRNSDQVITISKRGVKTEKTYSFWNNLYITCGLYLNMMIMGITEIMTQYIVYKSQLNSIIQSCMRGIICKSCNKCIKCFKNNIIKFIFKEKTINYEQLNYFLNAVQNEVSKKYNITTDNLYEIKTLESVLLFIYKNYDDTIKHPLIEKLKKEFSKYKKTSVMNWNKSSMDFITPKYRKEIINNIKKYTQ